MATKTYRLSPMFCNDHWSRDCGQTDKTVKEGKYCVYVQLDADGYADMLSDAELYSDHTHFDPPEDFYKLAQSAKRVVKVLKQEGPPEAAPAEPKPGRRLVFGWCSPGPEAAHRSCPATAHVHTTGETHTCTCECHSGGGDEW